jgi:hypothetical protein
MNLLITAQNIANGTRNKAVDDVWRLSERIWQVQRDAGFMLVEGEEGPVSVHAALGRLTAGRTKREGRGPVSNVEAWLQAEVVAASVAAAHELDTGQEFTPDMEHGLREAFAAFGLRQVDESALHPVDVTG